jgi:putative ABC transport system permease protein
LARKEWIFFPAVIRQSKASAFSGNSSSSSNHCRAFAPRPFHAACPWVSAGYSTTSIRVEGFQPVKDEEVWTYSNTIGPNYFRTMEIPLLRDRDFTQRDNENGPQVAIVNDSFASRFWKGEDPIGKRVEYGTGWVTVVGVARDSRYRRLVEPPSPMLFRPVLQSYQPSSYIHVRTGTDPRALAPAVQGVVRSLDPNLPVFNIQTLEAHISASSFQQRLAGSLLGVFGMLALTLAAVGLYGVISYAVGQRTREIGIRIALGAQEGDILRLVVRLGVGLAMFGVGLAAAVALSRLLTGLLFGITPTDPVTYFAVAAMLVSVALLASYIPALRATRIDPMAALRYE